MRDNDLPLGVKRLARNYSMYTMLLVGAVSAWSWAGWGFPFVMAKDYEPRMYKLESTIDQVLVGQLDSKELTLQTRVQDLEREIARSKPDDPLQVILVRQKNEAEQDLARVRRQLTEKGAR